MQECAAVIRCMNNIKKLADDYCAGVTPFPKAKKTTWGSPGWGQFLFSTSCPF